MKERLIMIMLVVAAFAMPATAQEPLDATDAAAEVAAITSSYTDWSVASWQGKLKTDALFISPTVKTFMERGKRTSISVRVPLMGEALRIEVDNDSVTIINKMKKVYWSEPASLAQNILPDFLNESQSLMLGRIVAIGRGELSSANAADVDVYSIPDGGYLLVPALPADFSGASYGYAVDSANQLVAIMASGGKPASESTAEDSFSLAVDIAYKTSVADGGASAGIAVASSKMNFSATLDVDAIDWSSTGFDRLTPGKNYRKVSFKECLKF